MVAVFSYRLDQQKKLLLRGMCMCDTLHKHTLKVLTNHTMLDTLCCEN